MNKATAGAAIGVALAILFPDAAVSIGVGVGIYLGFCWLMERLLRK